MPTESGQPMTNVTAMDGQGVHDDYERAPQTFHRLLDAASQDDLEWG